MASKKSDVMARFGRLMEEKLALAKRMLTLVRQLNQILPQLNRALEPHLLMLKTSELASPKKPGRKHLQCPKCERRFAHPLPMSRHLKATHGITVGKKNNKKR